ncbi:retinol dehydrogenase 13-like [Sitodiplosis mosellana]|uniref:retinol dehydrogenase 13-like n=1 Tax=Sitodiplosis mosellana TaxID=263140 RepID=UPI002445103C|nr:retinol dehydrogenase 13-like [Sitodiplosis mosellana]
MGLFDSLKSRPMIFTSAFATAGLLCAFLKDQMQGEKFKDPIKATDKRIVITGTTSGIGKETARELAKREARVYMACRDMKKCEQIRDDIILESANKHVHCIECDLSSMDSIRKFVKEYKERENRLDILINNAGVMRCPHTLTKDGFEMQLGVNHMGHFLLTNLLLDLITKSAPSRIINVSSAAHLRGKINAEDINSEKSYDSAEAYNQSKLANIMFTRELARKLTGTGVTVNAVNPGLVDTEITRHMGVFKSLSGMIFRPLTWPFLKTPKSGAQTTIMAALEPRLANKSGLYYSNCTKDQVSEEAKNKSVSDWLWTVSEKWTGLDGSSDQKKK